MTQADLTNKGCWVVDRKISLGFILALLIHAVAVVGWLVRMDSRLATLEAEKARNEMRLDEVQKLSLSIASMKTDISWMRSALENSQASPLTAKRGK